MCLICSLFIICSPDEPGGGDKPSDEKRKEQTTPVVSPSQGSPEAKEERYETMIVLEHHEWSVQTFCCLVAETETARIS